MNDMEMLDFVREYEYTEEDGFQPPIRFGHVKYEKKDCLVDPEIEKLIKEEFGDLI